MVESAITPAELVERVRAKLAARPSHSTFSHFSPTLPSVEAAAYVLIVGAGFSYGQVPLVGELMDETIGDYYYPDQDQSSMERPRAVLRENSASFWGEFNHAARDRGVPEVAVDHSGLPVHPGAAYQNLFTYEAANALFALAAQPAARETFLERLLKQRDVSEVESARAKAESDVGTAFVKGFLRYVLDPGSEHGHGSTGRHALNPAHIYLAALLEAQQLGNGWGTCAFCRMILTTNFDTLLQNALQKVNLLYTLTDNPDRGFDRYDLLEEEGAIRLVYLHGSILRHNPASARDELGLLSEKNAAALRAYLETRDVIAIGYGGWKDGLMAALGDCDAAAHHLYWCDVSATPPPRVADLLHRRRESATYVHLGEGGADGLMRTLYESLTPEQAMRDPMRQSGD